MYTNPQSPSDYVAARAQATHCVLCGAPSPAYVGVFVPTHPEQWPAGAPPPGKVRTYWYALCDRCVAMQDAPAQVEAVILAGMN